MTYLYVLSLLITHATHSCLTSHTHTHTRAHTHTHTHTHMCIYIYIYIYIYLFIRRMINHLSLCFESFDNSCYTLLPDICYLHTGCFCTSLLCICLWHLLGLHITSNIQRQCYDSSKSLYNMLLLVYIFVYVLYWKYTSNYMKYLFWHDVV